MRRVIVLIIALVAIAVFALRGDLQLYDIDGVWIVDKEWLRSHAGCNSFSNYYPDAALSTRGGRLLGVHPDELGLYWTLAYCLDCDFNELDHALARVLSDFEGADVTTSGDGQEWVARGNRIVFSPTDAAPRY